MSGRSDVEFVAVENVAAVAVLPAMLWPLDGGFWRIPRLRSQCSEFSGEFHL
jgi:hypothetical protein